MQIAESQDHAGRKGGRREVKRRETHRRITEAAVRLFLEKGYGATTLDAIADAAAISRRTFFAYFKSKDEILQTWQQGGWEEFLADVRRASPDAPPLQVIRDTFTKHMARYNTEDLKAIAHVMSSSESLRAAKHASYAAQERLLFETLCEVWRQPERRMPLRLIAMSAVGVLRVAVEMWEKPDNQHTLPHLFAETLDALGSALS